MKSITLKFDNTTFEVLQEYCRRYVIIETLDINPIISHDSKCSELTRELETYLQDKVSGILGYNYTIQYRSKLKK